MVRSRLKIRKAEMNISLMVFTSGLIDILGHGFVLLYGFLVMAEYNSPCTNIFGNFAFALSHVLNLPIYLVFNMNFRKCFLSIVLCRKMKSTAGSNMITMVWVWGKWMILYMDMEKYISSHMKIYGTYFWRELRCEYKLDL